MCMCKSSKMFCTSSCNCRFINWNNSSIRVGNKMWSTISQMSYSMSSMSSSNMTISMSMSYYSLSSKMVSTGSNNSRLICRNNSSIRMSYKVCV